MEHFNVKSKALPLTFSIVEEKTKKKKKVINRGVVSNTKVCGDFFLCIHILTH